MLIVQKSRKTPVATFAIASLVVVAVAVSWYATSGPGPAPAAPTSAPASAAPATPVAPRVATAPIGLGGEPTPPAPPEDPARVFELGFSGSLVVDASTVTALDRLQSLLGENPTPEDVARLENQLRQGLPREEADKAIKLFHGYRGYTQDMRNDVMSMGVPQTREAADALLARMNAVQGRHFEAGAADAMFGEQNRLSKAVLDAALIDMDGSLSATQKKEKLDSLRATLPEAQRHAIPEPPAEPASAPQ